MTTVLWARHGQNEANLTRTFSHRVYDGDLTEMGRRQADELAARVAASEAVTLLASSPLRRARQTADVLGERLGLPVSPVLDEFRELDVGELDGRSDDASWQVYERVLAAWRAAKRDARFPGGESRPELCARLRRGLCRVVEAVGERSALVVAHGAAIRAALPELAGVPDPGVDLATGTYARLRVDVRGDDVAVALLSWPRA